jgi:hypothetical protein
MAHLPWFIWIHLRQHTPVDLGGVIHIHLARVSMPLAFVNRWLALHSGMVVVGESGLTWVISELVHLCIIVIILFLLLKVLLGGIVAQNLLLFLLVLVLG